MADKDKEGLNTGLDYFWDKVAKGDWKRHIMPFAAGLTDEQFFIDGKNIIESFQEFLTIDTSSVVLDYGCGPGRLSRYLCQISSQVYAMDKGRDMLRLAKANIPRSNIQFLHSGQLDVLEDDSFTHVVCYATCIHMLYHDFIFAMHNFARILKKGGKILFDIADISSKDFFDAMIKELKELKADKKDLHSLQICRITCYSQDLIAALCKHLGLKIIYESNWQDTNGLWRTLIAQKTQNSYDNKK